MGRSKSRVRLTPRHSRNAGSRKGPLLTLNPEQLDSFIVQSMRANHVRGRGLRGRGDQIVLVRAYGYRTSTTRPGYTNTLFICSFQDVYGDSRDAAWEKRLLNLDAKREYLPSVYGDESEKSATADHHENAPESHFKYDRLATLVHTPYTVWGADCPISLDLSA